MLKDINHLGRSHKKLMCIYLANKRSYLKAVLPLYPLNSASFANFFAPASVLPSIDQVGNPLIPACSQTFG